MLEPDNSTSTFPYKVIVSLLIYIYIFYLDQCRLKGRFKHVERTCLEVYGIDVVTLRGWIMHKRLAQFKLLPRSCRCYDANDYNDYNVF